MVQSRFTVGATGTKYCFSMSTQGSGFDNTGCEIDIIATACGGAGNIIAHFEGGTVCCGNELDNCLSWTATASDAGKTYYIQLSDNIGGCRYLGTLGSEIVLLSYRLGSCSCSAGKIISLPVELFSFTGEKKSDAVHLQWQTATEINNDNFTIERSTDGKNWQAIGKVKGAGYSSTEKSYEFVDEELPPATLTSTIYYRLRQTDFDGKYEFFGPISVMISPTDDWKLIIKNPATDELKGTLFTTEDSKVMIEVIDLQGRNIHSETLSTVKGSNLLDININNVEQGAYFMVVHDSHNKIQSKFVKLNPNHE